MYIETLTDAEVTQMLMELFNKYSESSVLLGLVLPFIDAFIPILPLWVFITVNVYAFGFISGFIISWVGSVLGNTCVFFILRRIGRNNITEFLYRPNKNHPILGWIDNASFLPMFIYFALPFTPAFVLVIFAAFVRVRVATFMLAMITGKFVMIFFIAYVGKDFKAIIENPIKGVVYVLIMLLAWFVGRKFENRMASKGNENSSHVQESC